MRKRDEPASTITKLELTVIEMAKAGGRLYGEPPEAVAERAILEAKTLWDAPLDEGGE